MVVSRRVSRLTAMAIAPSRNLDRDEPEYRWQGERPQVRIRKYMWTHLNPQPGHHVVAGNLLSRYTVPQLARYRGVIGGEDSALAASAGRLAADPSGRRPACVPPPLRGGGRGPP